VKKAQTRWLTAIALVAWLLCFGVLHRFGTWLPFGIVGALLATLAIAIGALPSARLRPSPSLIGIGVLSGSLMVALTHAGYRLAAALLPGVPPATRTLFGLLDAVGLSTLTRSVLVVVIASCEEILFRAPLLVTGPATTKRAGPIAAHELRRVCAYAALYAITTVPLGSPLLVLCALVCGIIWGILALLTGTLMVPILTHVIWDLGVLLVWPLANRR
jgi:membrane protease YdiL (CAAX protease family)